MKILLCLLLSALPLVASKKPNVILIFADDLGIGLLGSHGQQLIKTPHLDKLAGESVWLEDFHVAPSCSPTRSSMLTGRSEPIPGRSTIRRVR